MGGICCTPSDVKKQSPAANSAPVKVYGIAYSTCTRRVLTALVEKNVPYELVSIDLAKGAHKTPEFITKQPFGVIPVLEHGDVRVFESRAIIRYIASTWAGQGTDLLGPDPASRAVTDAWLEAESQNYNPPVASIVNERMFKAMQGDGPPDESVVEQQLEKLNKVLDVYEGILQNRKYLAGDKFTLADLSHLPYTTYVMSVGVTEPFQSRPAVQAWWDRISARTSWKTVTSP